MDSDGKCVLDDLVKPENRIINYLTKYTHTHSYTHAFISLINNITVLKTDFCCVCYRLPPDRFSGITAAMLRPITTTLRDVQAKLRMLLPRDAVLVGHSINNDLIALKVSDYTDILVPVCQL